MWAGPMPEPFGYPGTLRFSLYVYNSIIQKVNKLGLIDIQNLKWDSSANDRHIGYIYKENLDGTAIPVTV